MKTRRAEWIWRERPALTATGLALSFGPGRSLQEDKNCFVYFRKSFDIAADVKEAITHISADGRYQLFVNGQFVGRGPARCDPAFQYYDSYDIAPYLQKGANVIAVLGHSYGQNMAWYQLPRHEHAQRFACGGIFVQSDVITDGNTIYIDSDESWRYLEAYAWQQDTSAGAVGFVEIYDARLAALGWQTLDFDDSGWPTATLLKSPGRPRTPMVRPFPHMVARDIPHLLERPQSAASLHRCGEVTEVPTSATLPQQIGAEAIYELKDCQVEGLSNLLGAGETKIRTVAGKAVAIVLDFGGTVTGRPVFTVTAPAGAIIDIGCSERLQDDHIEPREHTFLTSENIDRVITRAGQQSWERFEWTGFRYLQLTIRNAQEPLVIHDISLNFTIYPSVQEGSFQCSDELLGKIWQAGVNTLQLCMHDGFEDCPQREQRQFVGDAYVEILVNFIALGDSYLSAKFLRQVQQSQRADGMTQTSTPSDMAALAKTAITDYALYWLMSIREYVRYTGDAEIVSELFPGVERVIAWFERYIDEDGLLYEPPHWIFIDWAELDKRGQCTALNAQFVYTLRLSAELAEII
ncbi:MAG: family 78 glycoside hydrolase catalytic domain, partial [Trueperaceae bacterium]|nr:family 78 glycoside hydrolase catalytic domain [Trueperaceae bacterium]